MAATKEEIKELAEHIYDLDAEVYVHLGSSWDVYSTVTESAASMNLRSSSQQDRRDI